MHFDDLIDRPSLVTLSSVLDGRRLDLIAPYARRGALDRIIPAAHDKVRMIVRLPNIAVGAVTRIENDPRDLIKLLQRLGSIIDIYALPGVHTKLYINENRAFYGSANFTITGFGNNPESLLTTTHLETRKKLRSMFSTYLKQSFKLNMTYLNKLKHKLENGDITYTATPEQPQTLFANPIGDDSGDFRTWLAHNHDADSQYIEDRFDPAAGYNMSGHVQSGFPGIRTFLRENLDLIPALSAQNYVPYAFWPPNPEVVRRFREFVVTKGHLFAANGGGAWKHKLPPPLGGSGPSKGGRGSGLVARMLIYLSRYAIEKGF